MAFTITTLSRKGEGLRYHVVPQLNVDHRIGRGKSTNFSSISTVIAATEFSVIRKPAMLGSTTVRWADSSGSISLLLWPNYSY